MVLKFTINRVMKTALCGLMLSFNFNAIAQQQHDNTAPRATAQEAKLRHWSVPEIDQDFWNIAELDKPYFTAAPQQLNDNISVGQLGQDGGNKSVILALAQELTDKKHAELDSLLIAHKGKLLFESYYLRGRIDLPHPQSSTTKAYTALALGRAIQLGYLSMDDLHKPVVRLIDGLNPSKFVEGIENITLHHVLTMSSGLRISEEKIKEYRENRAAYTGINQIQAYFEDSEPVDSHDFNYSGINTIIVMQILDTVVPGSVSEFVKNELLLQMGILNYDWRLYANGAPVADSASSMTSRNMLKIGTLILNKGKWNEQQLIPEAFINIAVNPIVPLTEEITQNFYSGDKLSNSNYGYFWWQTDLQVGDKRYATTSAQGGGGVTILIVEELELVAVVTAHAMQAYLQMIAEKVLPAFAP